MNNKGPLLACGLFCLWPVAFYFIVTYLKGAIQRRDWQNIHWDEIKFPWSKEK
jgi:hypothetical protein